VLSLVYPWTLVLVGALLTRIVGPRADPLLLVAGGIFIASFVLRTSAVAVLSCAAALVLFLSVATSPEPLSAEAVEIWTSSLSAMVAVILSAAIAGRMLVAALTRTLAAREALVTEVIEERRVLEETVRALETTRTQLTQAQKLELISQLAGGIAHDMNNALTAVICEASLLDDEVAEERERIVQSASYAATLTGQLMTFGRRDTSQPRPIDLGATLAGLQHSLRRMLPGDISLTTDVPNERIAIVADPTQVLQVVLNLAANAKDAMQGGGQFVLRLSREGEGVAVLTVRDTGIGIGEQELARVFEPFFTTKPPGQGTGLGLANVRQLVEGMGGTVRVSSEVRRGTTFEIRIPTTTAEVASVVPRQPTVVRHRGTILVVDDDVRVRALVFTALQRVGHRVFEASSLAAALNVVRDERCAIDLLLTDVVMAGGGGAQTIESVRELCPDVAVLVMSGYADDETLRRGIARGEYPFIAKPFTADALAEAVERSLSAAERAARAAST
jgi:signal transduction histidine kinase/CheY-like chemotaxis protein